jgi:hypothetical protein
VDPTGFFTILGTLIESLDDARGLHRHLVRSGQVLVAVADGRAAMFGTNEYATVLSVLLEEKRGVDLRARYEGVLGLGPRYTEHGAAIEAAAAEPGREGDDRRWTARLETAGLRVVDRASFERAHGRPAPLGQVFIEFPSAEFDDD